MENKYSYEKKGSKAVILFHAYTGTPNDVNSVGRALERENYTVMMPTFDGHGLEDPNELLKYGIKDWIKNGEEAYQTLKDDGFTDISVFGLSLGGVVATHLMLNEEVKSYGVFSSPVLSLEESTVPENFWVWYRFKMKKLGHDEAEIDAKKDQVMSELEEVLAEINQYTKELSDRYPNVKLPVFIGQGGKDQMIPPKQAEMFKEALVNAKVNYHWYEEAPHVITTGRAGKELQKDLIAFLEDYA
ncbi:MAG TPA: alpha/beta hydrolase [Atopostipes sp.]|nr:alpha/beta hydrolase [Atopostipes sp.]